MDYNNMTYEQVLSERARLEDAQEVLKPFAKRADMLDQTDGWRAANRRESIYDLAAVRRARDVLLEQKVWDRLPEVTG